jgi:hypothetical protein
LTLAAVPPSPSPGQQVVLTATVQDSSNNAIPNVPVTLGGTVPALQNQTIVTGTLGTATKSFVAPSVPGVYTITASGNGVNAGDYQIQVFSTVIPTAVIPAGANPSLAASPNVLAVNTPGQSTNKSTLRFLFLDPQNRPIPNVRVRFQDITTGLPTVGSSVVSGATTLFTDASGIATTQYVSGQNFSPTNGVTIKACYSAVDFVSTTDCPAFVTASLTVAGQALAVSIGDDNLIEKGQGTYIKRFTITVADAAGKAVANAPVDISVDLTHYGKGRFEYPFILNNAEAPALSVVPQSLTAAYPSITTDPNIPITVTSTTPSVGTSTTATTSTTTIAQGQRVWCANEDTNRNGNVDPGENINSSIDSNGQPTLEPRKSDLLVSYDVPTVTTTDKNGILIIKVEYSQRFGTWLAYKPRVTANVAGSQGMAERLFITKVAADDVVNGSFLTPPYGFNSCVSPN